VTRDRWPQRGDKDPRFELMKKVAFAALAGLTMTTAALPADLTPAPAGAVWSNTAAQYEVGSAWYIRGDLGENWGASPSVGQVSITPPPPGDASNPIAPTYGPSGNFNSWSWGVGFGYQYSPNLRFDATYDHFNAQAFKYTGTVVCPFNATGIFNQFTGATLGVLYDTNQTCNGTEKITNNNNVLMFNAYYDIPMAYGLTPYVGAGAGVNFLSTTGTLAYTRTSDGSTYSSDLTVPAGYPAVWVNNAGVPVNPQPKIAFAPQNWNRQISTSQTTMAVAVMAGLAYHFNEWVTLDIGYRYLNANIAKPSTNYSNDFRAGLRIYAN
jgi:opacity protein-like surface antigen